MRFTLMHRDREAIDIDLLPDGTIADAGSIKEPAAMPWGTNRQDHELLLEDLRSWWSFRHIPKKRPFIDERLSNINVASTKALMVGFNSLNLSDHYWLRTDPKQTWDDMSMFSNDFSESLGRYIMEGEGKISIPSPESATDGVIPKMWRTDRTLIKGGTDYWQQPFNEVIASELMRRLGVDHVHYDLEFIEDRPFCVCRTFSSEEVESIPARCLMHATNYRLRKTMYSHLMNSCRSYNIGGAEDFINKMITVDSLMGNSDRHYNNFVITRNPKTLEILGFGPIFDTGSSLGFDMPMDKINPRVIKGRTFKQNLDRQLHLVTDFEWFNPEALEGLDDYAFNLISKSGMKAIEDRAEVIANFIKERIDIVVNYSEKPEVFRDEREEDIFVD